MANYNQVSYGSKGSDVTELQKLLNKNGANLTEDGIFGDQTKKAVQEYQQKNGLSVDGIVGNNTWGALTKASSASTENTAATETNAPTFEYEAYKPSDTVAQAEALLQQQLAQKPGAYTSAWQTQLNDIIQKIQNREKFSYDLNGDALYQQYKDQYTTQGKLAMMDTMGQAAAMTGGYGNSYAQTAGQQAYQASLQQLNDVVPELYQLALSQYNQEGDDMYDQASLIAGMENQDYGRYRDQTSDYYTELDRLTEDARYKAENEYGKWSDQTNMDYGIYRDNISDQQWQAQFDEAKRQYDEQMALSQSKSSGGSSSGGGGGGGSYDAEAAKKQQELRDAGYDVVVDGIWGPQSKAAWEKYQAGGTPATAVDTENTKLFRSSIMDSNTFAKHGNKATVKGKTYTNYKSYIEAALADWTDNNVPYIGRNLTDDEVEFLMDYYGL